MKKFIREKIIKQKKHDELDIDIIEKLIGDFIKSDYEIIYDDSSISWNEGDYISIDLLEKTI